MQHKDGQTLRGLAILLLSIQGLLDGDGGQCAGKLHQHRRQQRQCPRPDAAAPRDRGRDRWTIEEPGDWNGYSYLH